jgi:hypothetical protein
MKILTKMGSIILLIVTISCDPLEYELQYPGVSIYKTNADYFNNVDIGMHGDEIYRTESFWNARYNTLSKLRIENNDTVYKGRYKLSGGYILDSEAILSGDVFLDLTHKQHLIRELNGEIITHDTIRRHILDADPYIEFYRNRTDVKRFYIVDTLEINEIIKNGEIDKYFERLK